MPDKVAGMIQRLNRFAGLLLLLAWGESSMVRAQPTNAAALQTEMDQAKARVRQIVNQPVIRLVRQRGMQVRVFSPGWFHEGASPPSFNTADVRTTQDRIYDQLGYVTSDLNPGYVFIGSQLEFNPQLKYFYTDRSIPKKKLSEAEMVEINRLYRIIGRCERELAVPGSSSVVAETESNSGTDTNADQETETVVMVRQPIPRSRYIQAGLSILAVLALYVVYREFVRRG
jgi:hypothetical protein